MTIILNDNERVQVERFGYSSLSDSLIFECRGSVAENFQRFTDKSKTACITYDFDDDGYNETEYPGFTILNRIEATPYGCIIGLGRG